MAKTRNEKEGLLAKYKSMLTENPGYIAVDSKSIDNQTVTDLKKELRELGSNLTVVKNTIFKIALDDSNMPVETKDFDGQTAVIPYAEDPTIIAKLVKKVQKESKLLEARYGIVAGEFITKERVMQLAEIPSREELLAKMLGSMTSPISGFMNVVTGNVKGFVQVIKQVSEKGE